MEDNFVYYIDYSYYDKRHYRREKHITCHNLAKAQATYKELRQQMIDDLPNAPIEVPHVVKAKAGEMIGAVNFEEEV